VLRARGAKVSKPVPIAKGGGRTRVATRRGGRKRTTSGDIGRDVLLQALESQELTATHEFTIAPTRPAAGARRGAAKRPTASLDIAVDVAPEESAVILVEQDGEYTWHFPPASAAPGGRSRRSAAKRPVRNHVTISITLTPGLTRPAAPGGRRGISVGGLLGGRGRAVILKFIARTAAGVGMKFLERNVRKGLIVMNGDDPQAWRRVSHIDDLELPDKPQLRILLWVHGTFSSTAGSFGALTATPDGRLLLKQARERYDAVIGFDHSTLAETPQDNAVDLVERLGRFKKPMQIDAVTYSRGGLVFRSLVEQILATSDTRPDVRQVVFVGVPNHGTLLADPEHWKNLVDIYTNLSMGAFALMQRLPAAAPTAFILAEIVSGLGAFVKYLAEVVVTEAVVPGLAAQAPNSPFVRALNETGPGQPLPNDCRYLAVTSNFDPRAAAGDGAQPTGLAASFLGKLADGVVDRLMHEANDLVVNTGSMKQIDPGAGEFIDASLDFGDSPMVYHTVYFAQAGVAQQLRGWLMDDHAREGFIERHGLLSVRPSPTSAFTRVRFHETEGRRRAPQPVSRAASTSHRGARKRRIGAAARTEATVAAPRPNARAISAAARQHLTKLFGERLPTEPMKAADMAPAAGASRARGAKRQGAVAARPGEDAVPRPRAYAPRLEERSQQCSTLDADRRIQVVSFRQTHRSIPIFGSRTTVELDDANNLVAARAKLGRVDGVSETPDLSAQAAFVRLLPAVAPLDAKASAALAKRVATDPPALTFFYDRPQHKWHLAYIFSDVPAVPATWSSANQAGTKKRTKAGKKSHSKHGSASSPRERFPILDYLVDAHDGSIVYYYSVSPAAKKAAKKRVPEMFVRGRGVDEDGIDQVIFVREVKGGFELNDPVRKIRTFDFGGRNIDVDVAPKMPIRIGDATANFASASTPGVSAHLNVSRVFQFYNDVLIRRGVDDRGSYLDNMVNCISPEDEDPPLWGNAVWWKKKMWYGQVEKKKKKLRSVAASLDIIGHELTHGVTENTCNLVYRDESGALNESFSDIFGVIIANRVKDPAVYANPDKWDWAVGVDLGEKGKPLRNMKTPKITGDPDHVDQMKDFDPADLEEDFGGVHTFSNIHNKAAYNLLTTRTGKRGSKTPLVVTPDEVAQLYYFTLQRLDRLATFEDVLETMLDVVKTVYREPKDQAAKLAAVTAAYAAVGIPRK
jgi:bacillolysin/neutral peptidase B